MGGFDWSALPSVIELLGVTDIEPLIVRLATIREWNKDNPLETE